MKKEDFNILLKERVADIEQKLVVKRDEYAYGEDVFVAFKRATGISFHDCPEQLAWEYMTKHLQSIKDMVQKVSREGVSGVPEKEVMREKFGDAINYLLLIELMMLERSRLHKPA